MRISHSKCNILTIGRIRDHNSYLIDNNPISKTTSVRDLGITVDHELKFNLHINNIVQRGQPTICPDTPLLSFSKSCYTVKAFKIYIRPILEYASTTWSPSYIHHINLLERVQRSFTKRIPGCSHLSYLERLLHLNLHTLEQRRLFADLIMCYNIVKGNNCIDPSTFFSFPNYKFSRGHPLKISIPLAKLNARKFFFASRVIPAWNSLPETTVMAPSTSSFKHHLHHTDFSKFLIFPSAIK